MNNEGIYSVVEDLVKQNITFCQTKCFTGTLRDDPVHTIFVKDKSHDHEIV